VEADLLLHASGRAGDCRPTHRQHLPNARAHGRLHVHAILRQHPLDEWAGLLDRWSKEIEVFAYFNKDWERYAINNAILLKSGSPNA
jgi:uncharacterized protein YecE (DUF72 family)